MFVNGEVWAISYLAAEWAIRLAMLVIVPFRRSAEAARSWLLLTFFLPIPALAIYFFIGRPSYPLWRRERFRRLPEVLSEAATEIRHSRYCSRPSLPENLTAASTLIENLGSFPAMSGNDIELIVNYDDAIARLVEDIDRAQESIHLLYYIFGNDETGRLVMEALIRAVGRGVACRVLLDAMGSQRWARSVSRQLSDGGVEVRLALAVGLLRRRSARADLRNHRKIAVIDGSFAYLGSQNIVNAEFRSGIVNEELVARVAGPVVAELQAVFVGDWYMEAGEVLNAPELFPHRHPLRSGVVAQVLPSGPDYPDAGMGHLMVALVHGARERIVLTTPYFIPDEPLLQALKTAAMRGVEVRLVVSSIVDHVIVGLAQRSYYTELLEAGVRIHSYEGGFLHAKHATFDRDIALVGSANIDIRSFVLNAEISLIFFASDVVVKLEHEQMRYFASSAELRTDIWEKRPILRKTCENIARLASPLL